MNLQTYLEGASPDDWHQVAWNWNWDSGEEYLQWIARQPNCDRGTALLLYWTGNAFYYTQFQTRDEVPSFAQDGYDLIMQIEARALAGDYSRQEIAYDPTDDEDYDWTEEYDADAAVRPIPALMMQASPGRSLQRDDTFIDGYPPGVSAEEAED